MGERSAIEWTDATFNPWIGCDKVSPACDFCYAEALNKRTGGNNWGVDVPRRRTTAAYWNGPLKWDAKAAVTGRRPWVFCASLADVFDKRVPSDWRADLFDLIESTPNLRWQLLTKRIGNAAEMLPARFPAGFAHVGIMSTIANQQEAARDIPKLVRIKAERGVTWIGLSCEPLLGPVDLTTWLPSLDWVVAGGESGPHARPSHPDWFRHLRDQCAAAEVPFLFKQWGEWAPGENAGFPATRSEGVAYWGNDRWLLDRLTPRQSEETHRDDEPDLYRFGKRRAGRLLDGRTHDGFPEPP